MVSTMQWLQNHIFVLNLQKFQMFNLDSQETSAATIPLFLTFCSAEIFVVKEKYSASTLQVTVIEYALPSHHPHPTIPNPAKCLISFQTSWYLHQGRWFLTLHLSREHLLICDQQKQSFVWEYDNIISQESQLIRSRFSWFVNLTDRKFCSLNIYASKNMHFILIVEK